MKKTYVTNMPNHIGAFLKASRCFFQLGINITRVSYNKAVDSHTLFIDVEGDEENLNKASEKLKEIGYLSNGEEGGKIILLEFRLEDKPGSVTGVLELISKFNFNISYISSQENGSGYQSFKMGLNVSDIVSLTEFITRAEKICAVKIIDYNRTERVYDNSIFYNSYVDGLVNVMNLSVEKKEELLVNVNLAMQTLDEQGLLPYKTFDSISKFAELLAESKGENFKPRITEHEITEKTKITLIEPDCGSNTAIIESDGERFFVDSGYACYKEEMLKLFNDLIPDFKKGKERIIVTHADVDHCGLLNEFDQVISSERTIECLKAESEKRVGYREKNKLHRPYVNICKILTEYQTVEKERLSSPWKKSQLNAIIEQIGFIKIGELNFEVYEGQGGHLAGEIILIDFEHRVAFTGDIFVNLKEMTKKQAEYNQYAPILMTSVDTDSALCSKERVAVLQRMGVGEWFIFGGHGQKKAYQTQAIK
ncbi:MAG: MBL fold metallo-hydrolase [Clostridia bacterium]|nr:MBL fold metallo-hydrolase [Clostridia bacterium]